MPNKLEANTKKDFNIERRDFIKQAGKVGLGSATILGFPNILHARNKKPTIKVIGTHVTLQETIRLQAEKDLGINIEFYPGGSAEVIYRATTNPESFDIYEQWSNSLKVLWKAGSIQPIDINRLTYWDEINSLTKTGKITAHANYGQGDSPYKLLYVQPDGNLDSIKSNQVSFMPYVHNVDSFGYDSSVIKKGIPYETESWKWLLDDSNHGKVAIVNEPTIGLFDLALAVQAKGLMSFSNIGNMERNEIDKLFEILLEYKRNGHFRGVWTSVPNSIDLMKNKEVSIESMFSPAASALKAQGVPCIYAAPKEGYRAWHGVMCLSSSSKDERKDAAYQFMNWWLSGWAGAFVARQGYYISNPERSRKYMTNSEWDYWYQGKSADKDLYGTDGNISVRNGEYRNGGSYIRRFENVAVWNSVMDEYEYVLTKWSQFVTTQQEIL